MSLIPRIQSICDAGLPQRPGKPRLDKAKFKAGRKRVQRLMREDNLLCVAKRKFVVTTDSAHPLRIYPNLPPGMEVTGINQLLIADIT